MWCSAGGFTYLQGCSNTYKGSGCYGTLKSRRILPEAGWNCLQFWYFLETTRSSSLKVSLIINETNAILWSSEYNQGKAGHWIYVRLPIDSSSTPYQVNTTAKYKPPMLLDKNSFLAQLPNPFLGKEGIGPDSTKIRKWLISFYSVYFIWCLQADSFLTSIHFHNLKLFY